MPIGMHIILIGTFVVPGCQVVVLTQATKTTYHENRCSQPKSIFAEFTPGPN